MKKLDSSGKPPTPEAQRIPTSKSPNENDFISPEKENQSQTTPEVVAQPSPSASSLRQGPTSSGFAFDVARERLQVLGLDSVDSRAFARENQLELELMPQQSVGSSGNLKRMLERDPLWQVEKDEVFRLINVWASGIGAMFPVVDVDKLRARWNNLSIMLAHAKTDGSVSRLLAIAEVLFDTETNILKLVLTNCLAAESGGMNELAKRLFETMKGAPLSAFWEAPSLNNISLLVLLVSLY